MKEKLLFPVRTFDGCIYRVELSSFLESMGYDIEFIPYNKKISKMLSDITKSNKLNDDLISHVPNSNYYSLIEKYNIESPKKLVFPQRVYDYSSDTPSYRRFLIDGSKGKADYERILHKSLDYFDNLFRNDSAGTPVNNEGAGIPAEVSARVGRANGFEPVWRGFSPLSKHHRLYTRRPPKLETLEKVKYPDISQKDVGKAKNYIQKLEDKKPIIGRNSRISIDDIRSELMSLVSATDTYDKLRNITRGRIKSINKFLNSIYYRDIEKSKNIIKDKPFVYYPIQYFRESRITYRSPAYYNQTWLVEYMSRSLPAGYTLLIKDHPAQGGALPIESVRNMARYADFLHPNVNSHEIVQEADVTVVLNNTVGLESLLRGSPVVCLGDAIYTGMGYTHDVDDINNLSGIISNAVRSGGISREKQVEIAHAVHEESSRGIWGVRSNKELSHVADSIDTYIRNE